MFRVVVNLLLIVAIDERYCICTELTSVNLSGKSRLTEQIPLNETKHERECKEAKKNPGI